MLRNIRGISAFIVSDRPLSTTVGEGCNWLGPGCPERGLGPDCVSYIFVIFDSIIICRLHKSILSEKVQVTQPLTVFSIFSLSALVEGPNPLSATLVNVRVAEINILIMFRSMCYRI